MKSNYLLLAAALLISVPNFAQKDQIKAAEKSLKNGNSAEAIATLNQAESMLGSATDAEKAQYNFVKAGAYMDMANKKMDAAKNLSNAAKAYQEVLTIEKASGKSKYSDQVKNSIADIKNQLINSAVEAGTAKNYKAASELLYQVYELDKTDLEKLYYAANYAVNGQEYDKAVAMYEELKKQNFSGEGMGYYAKNIVNDQEEFFGSTPASKTDRDTKVRLKLYSNSRDEKIPSKRGEIYKNIALILVEQGKTDQAKAALADARTANPEDTSLSLAEANVYLGLKDFDTYKKLVADILEKSPNDPDLVYNLGVIASKTDPVAAEKYYKRAIEIKPDYVNAYLNLSILKLDGDKKFIDEMNKLGTSEKDNKRYEVLKKQRNENFTITLPYLEKAYELDPNNADVANTLLNVYGALEMTDKKKALKAKMGK